MAGELGNPGGGRGLTGDFRTAAIAKATGAGRGGFGPEPGAQGGQKELQGKVEARNRARVEKEQDKREAQGPYRVGSSRPRPIPGAQPNRTGNRHVTNPYGSARNYPTTV